MDKQTDRPTNIKVIARRFVLTKASRANADEKSIKYSVTIVI